MAAFYWSNGPASGGAVTMHLTVVGEVSNLDVRSSPATMGQPVPVSGFQQCIPTQTVDCGPVPLQFLPLTANGFGCGASELAPVPVATSPSPNDSTGPGPYCDVLTAGGTFTYTTQPGGTAQPGGGSPGSPFGAGTTPRDACDAAQNSYVLDLARSRFNYACQLLRSDQANVGAYSAAAATAATIAGGFIAAAALVSFWVAQLILAALAAVAAAVAIIFTALAFAAAADVSRDQQWLAAAQTLWGNAIASVRRACCPAWIVIQTDDLSCP
jgi:hypothetical protein